MLWQWFLVGRSGVARAIAVIAGAATALYLHNAHNFPEYYAYPIGTAVYLIVLLLWAFLARLFQQPTT
jgi:hypothetical protein